MTILVCAWTCGERLLSWELVPMSEMKGFEGSRCYSQWHRKGCFGWHSCCWFICLHEISLRCQGSERFRLSEVLDEHEHLLILSTNCALSQEKKKKRYIFFFSRKNILSADSWLSLWILFPQGWLFQHQAGRRLFFGTQFPSARKKSSAQPAKSTGCWEV